MFTVKKNVFLIKDKNKNKNPLKFTTCIVFIYFLRGIFPG
jgi:hypothetical protein